MTTFGTIHVNTDDGEEVTSPFRPRSQSAPSGEKKKSLKQKNALFEQLVSFRKEADAKMMR
jgi:hypothetical protein